jgi:hypothetical protein
MGVAKALRYPLTATCIPKKECTILDKLILKAALPALGFPPTFYFDIAQAPPEVLGLVIPSIWNDQQGIEHVAALLRHGDSQPLNVTGCLLRDEMATLHLELGMPGQPFEHSYKRHHLCSTQVFLHIRGSSAMITTSSSETVKISSTYDGSMTSTSCRHSSTKVIPTNNFGN